MNKFSLWKSQSETRNIKILVLIYQSKVLLPTKIGLMIQYHACWKLMDYNFSITSIAFFQLFFFRNYFSCGKWADDPTVTPSVAPTINPTNPTPFPTLECYYECWEGGYAFNQKRCWDNDRWTCNRCCSTDKDKEGDKTCWSDVTGPLKAI